MSTLRPRRAVFLDRDGVIVIPEFRDGRSFAPTRIEDYKFYGDAAPALRALKDAGFVIVVVTNQPDVGMGLIARATIEEMHRRLISELPVDDIRACFHTQDEVCSCRKPKPGMLLEAAGEFGIVLPDSFMVGDRNSDVQAGQAVGCRTVFIDLDYAAEPKPVAPTFVARSVSEAAAVILAASQIS